jgi:C4-dicarboxylate transporter DctQ subunit
VHRLNRALTLVENVVASTALAAAAIIAIVAVIVRYVFNEFIFWSEEAVIYLVLLSVFVGAVITLRHDEHVRVDLLPVLLKGRAKLGVQILASLLTLAYLGLLGAYGWVLLFEPGTSGTVTPALKLPLWVVYFALPLGFTLMFLRTLEVLFRQVTGREAHPEAAHSILDAEAEGLGMHIDPEKGTDPRRPGDETGRSRP